MTENYPWFRMYHEFSSNPKVQRLSEVDQRRYVMLLCMRCSNGDVTLHDEDIAFTLRITLEEWNVTCNTLLEKDLINKFNKPTGWGKRQKTSDSSTARVAAHRKRKKQHETVTETEVKRDCNAIDKNRVDKDKNRVDKDKNRVDKETTPRKRSVFVKPTIEEIRAYCQERNNSVDPDLFFNHYEANGWMRGKSKIKDWKACVRTWEANAKQKTTLKPKVDLDSLFDDDSSILINGECKHVN